MTFYYVRTEIIVEENRELEEDARRERDPEWFTEFVAALSIVVITNRGRDEL